MLGRIAVYSMGKFLTSVKKCPSLPYVVGGNDLLGASIYSDEVPPLDPPISGERV